MPPRGFKKGYVKHPDTNEWVDPRVLKRERDALDKEADTKDGLQQAKKKKRKNTGPETKKIKDDSEYAKIIIVWKDGRGHSRSTQYTMATLDLQENVNETYSGAHRHRSIRLTIDGDVLEKL